MPNQRKKGKAFIGGYVPKNVADAFKIAAEERGITAKDLLEKLIIEELKKKDTSPFWGGVKKIKKNHFPY